MELKYIRIQGRELSYITQKPKGIFSVCWRMVNDGIMTEADANKFKNIDCWFKENLPEPDPCKNRQKVITYFKTDTSKDMLKMLQPVLGLLDKYNHPYDIVYTNFIGEIVYEDKWQVAVRVDG